MTIQLHSAEKLTKTRKTYVSNKFLMSLASFESLHRVKDGYNNCGPYDCLCALFR